MIDTDISELILELNPMITSPVPPPPPRPRPAPRCPTSPPIAICPGAEQLLDRIFKL